MAKIAKLLTEHIDIWTAADIEKKSGRGRASGNAGSVYGIKKLRDLILELAVRGKLVPQDPNDEPASELLKRIQAEKAKLIHEGKLKKEKPLAPVDEDEKLFELPKGWECLRVGELFTFEYGNNLPEPKRTNTGEYPVYGSNGIVGTHNECFVNSKCIVIGRKGSAGALNLSLSEGCCVTDVAYYCVPPIELDLIFIFKLFHTLGLSELGKGIKPGLNRNEAYELVIAIPPLAEQHRIVAKVDELMALCDQLEQQQSNAHQANETLVCQLLATLTQSQSAAEFNANRQRIYAHFDVLFTTEASIDALKQAVLQLAVRGKLVPQDPNDEPASELLKRIQAEKAKLIHEGKLKKEKPLAPVDEDEKLFELPKGWEWVRLSQISKVMTGNAFSSEYFNEVDGTKTVKITNAGVHEFIETEDYLPENFNEKYPDFLIKTGDLVLAQTRPYISNGLKISVCPKSYDNSLLNQRVVAIRATSYIFNMYIYTYMKTPEVLNFYMNKFSNSGLQPNLKITDVTDLLIALPPVNQQHRIVTKVDELMVLCNQLKTRIQQANQQKQAIADALVAQAVN